MFQYRITKARKVCLVIEYQSFHNQPNLLWIYLNMIGWVGSQWKVLFLVQIFFSLVKDPFCRSTSQNDSFLSDSTIKKNARSKICSLWDSMGYAKIPQTSAFLHTVFFCDGQNWWMALTQIPFFSKDWSILLQKRANCNFFQCRWS